MNTQAPRIAVVVTHDSEQAAIDGVRRRQLAFLAMPSWVDTLLDRKPTSGETGSLQAADNV